VVASRELGVHSLVFAREQLQVLRAELEFLRALRHLFVQKKSQAGSTPKPTFKEARVKVKMHAGNAL
jgi:hypothetical protein